MRRATARGADRGSLDGERADVIVCGASFAGLAVARELALSGSRADVLLVDRYEVGERATSACAAPTAWLEAMGVADAIRQEIPCMAFHTPHGASRYRLPWSWSAFDYRALCRLLWEQSDARFVTAKVRGRSGQTVHTDRGDLSAPLLVDALGWRRVLAADGYQPPEAPLSRGLEVHPHGGGARPRRVDRPLAGAARLRLARPRRGRAAGGRRLVRAPPAREGADGRARPAARGRRGPLPGQLVPAPPASGGGGRGLLRRRLRRPLLPALGRGHPHRLLLRDRVRARARGRARRASAAARRRSRATRRSAPRMRGRSGWRSGSSA